jgi:hypothetical protein
MLKDETALTIERVRKKGMALEDKRASEGGPLITPNLWSFDLKLTTDRICGGLVLAPQTRH